MTARQTRINNLKETIETIENTIYPESYGESRLVMVNALKGRIRMLEELGTKDYLPSSQRG